MVRVPTTRYRRMDSRYRVADTRSIVTPALLAGRAFWIVNGPTRTGGGYRVVAGPLSSAELLARADTLVASP